jgi:hypothetical protein
MDILISGVIAHLPNYYRYRVVSSNFVPKSTKAVTRMRQFVHDSNISVLNNCENLIFDVTYIEIRDNINYVTVKRYRKLTLMVVGVFAPYIADLQYLTILNVFGEIPYNLLSTLPVQLKSLIFEINYNLAYADLAHLKSLECLKIGIVDPRREKLCVDINDFYKFTNLNSLQVPDIQTITAPMVFNQIKYFKIVMYVGSIQADLFELISFPHIKSLHIENYNGSDSVYRFLPMPELERLDIAGKIIIYNPGVFSGVKSLEISNTEINDHVLSHFTSLEHLGTVFEEDIYGAAFKFLLNLKTLHVFNDTSINYDDVPSTVKIDYDY